MLTVSDNHIVLGGGGGGSAPVLPDGWGSGWMLPPTYDATSINGKTDIYRASSAPSSTATDGIVLSVGQSITNSYDTPQNSYIRAMGHEITVSVITEQ